MRARTRETRSAVTSGGALGWTMWLTVRRTTVSTARSQASGSDTPSGLYVVSLGGGQVDTTSGQFVFSVTEGYSIDNGKLGAPLKLKNSTPLKPSSASVAKTCR